MLPTATLKNHAAALGFNLCGVIRAEPAPHLEAYLAWVAAGMHGTMNYMARPDRVARRRDLNVILPGIRSLVVVGLDYHTLRLPASVVDDPSRGRIAAYAWGADYHAIMEPRLHDLAAWVAAQTPASPSLSQHKVYVDTGAVLERDHAWSAGLGFIGKNTMLIHPRRGSGFFLGELLITLDFDAYDQPGPETRCGTCTRCLTACPTNAFPRPFTLDARRCISYLTIEHKDNIDPELRSLMGNWVYGCDVCQEVCPWNRFAVQTLESAFFPLDPDYAAPPLADLLRLNDSTFYVSYTGTAIERIGRDRLVRNACIAAGNSAQAGLIPLLYELRSDRSEIVREAATWALSRFPA